MSPRERSREKAVTSTAPAGAVAAAGGAGWAPKRRRRAGGRAQIITKPRALPPMRAPAGASTVPGAASAASWSSSTPARARGAMGAARRAARRCWRAGRSWEPLKAHWRACMVSGEE